MWDNLEKLNYDTSNAACFALGTHFLRDFTSISSKIILFVKFKGGAPTGEGAPTGVAIFQRAQTCNVTPLLAQFNT